MNQWWTSLSGTEQFLWGLALFSTVFFLIQTIVTLVGGGLDSDMDSDTSVDGDSTGDSHGHGDGGAGFLGQYFTIRNLVAFFLGFSWGGLAFVEFGFSTPAVVAAAMATGLVFVGVVMGIMRGIAGLRHSGTISLANAVGVTGTVTISIPGNLAGEGKISLVLQGRLIDLNAVTPGPELRTGSPVEVTGLSGNRLLVQGVVRESN